MGDETSTVVKLQSSKPPFLTVEVDRVAEESRYNRLIAARWREVPAGTPTGKKQKANAAGPKGQAATLPLTSDPSLNVVDPAKLQPTVGPVPARTGTGGRAKGAKGALVVEKPEGDLLFDDDGLDLLDSPTNPDGTPVTPVVPPAN